MGTLRTDNYTFFTISLSVLLRMRNISYKRCRRNQNTYFVFSNSFFFENYAFYETMWKNTVERGRQQMKIWRKRISWWILKPLNAELNPIRHLLTLVGARHVVHFSRIRVKATNTHTHTHTHTLRLCNTHYFSTATMMARMLLYFTLYVYILSCVTGVWSVP